jgi:hypothetical protein
VSTPISLTDPDGAEGDDSSFIAGTFLADSASASDALARGPVISDTGAGSDVIASVAVAAVLAETGAADDEPWQYDSVGAVLFPYYARVSEAALSRVNAGDQFLWYAGT